MTAPKFTYAGITDEVLTCGCCGRAVQKTVILLNEEGEKNWYGTACAAKLLGQTSRSVVKAATVARNAADWALVQRVCIGEGEVISGGAKYGDRVYRWLGQGFEIVGAENYTWEGGPGWRQIIGGYWVRPV